jgi:16S rRNA (guanine966-N2)-methyltransferase
VTRIIAGAAGGRRITVPPAGTRPTSDRVREALFSALVADPGLDGAAVLDLCAGSGALGLEALSRGAAHALFVESDRRAATVLRRNVAGLALPGAAVRAATAAAVLGAPADRAYDVVLVDPPYATPDAEVAGWLGAAHAHGWLAADAVVVVERGRGGRFPWPPALTAVRERRYGDTVLHTARVAAPREPDRPAPAG